MTRTVILDFLSDPMGGLLTSARAFLNRARRHDAASRIVVLEVNSAISGSIDDAKLFEWINVEHAHGLRGWRRLLWQNLELPAIARRYHADVYVSLSHYLPRTLPAGVRSVIGVSNLAPFSMDAFTAEVSWRSKLRLRLLRTSILGSARRADRVIALSQACRSALVARGIVDDKISVIPNGVSSLSESEPTPSAAATSQDAEFILCVSHFYRYKNFARLVRAYALLPPSIRGRYRLLLVGAPYDVSYYESIRSLVVSLGLGDRVKIIPGAYGDELADLYKKCSLFVFPSLAENSPITLLEAMTRGAPIAAADIPAIREMADDAAVYFEPRSEQTIAQALEAILSDPAKRAMLRAHGERRAKLYSWDDFAKRLVRLYQQLEA
jgi:glycosyltransferase involved in cell wall biosynthesis